MKPSWVFRLCVGIALLIGGIIVVEEASRGAPGVDRFIQSHQSASVAQAAGRERKPPLDPTALATRILARPLFAPGRRPFTAAAAEAAPDAAPSELRLVGIVFFSGARRALMAVSGSDKAVLVGPGSRIAGRVIREIDRDRVVLYGADGAETIAMTPMKSSSTDGSGAVLRPNASP